LTQHKYETSKMLFNTILLWWFWTSWHLR